MEAAKFARINREECKRTKHDSQFSKWQVLIGPSDWEDYALGKEGADRYRVHNLPTTTGPGLYELGVAVPRNGLGRDVDKLDSDRVVVVYLGQADSVRTRLQCYGRTGAHLNNPNDCGLKTEPGYFDDIFRRGLSIVYRWVPMKNKADALKTENELLNKFDYAWNKGSNGTRRHDDVQQKINNVASSSFQFPKPVRKLLYFSQKPVGIKIKASKLLSQGNKLSNYADEESHNLFSKVFMFSRVRPRLVLDRCGAGEENTGFCGVSLVDGSVCTRPPVEGRKRCAQHRRLKINELIPTLTANGESQVDDACSQPSTSVNRECDGHDAHNFSFFPQKIPVVAEKCPVSEGSSPICGVVLNDGNLCRSQPVRGNKRCDKHKWRATCGSSSMSAGTSQYLPCVVTDSSAQNALNCDKNPPEMHKPGRVQLEVFSERSIVNLRYDNTICGVELGNGLLCSRQPVTGRMRCEEHEGLKVDGLISNSASRDKCHGYDTGSNFSTYDDRKYCTSVCGALTLSGSYCKRPVKGNSRCWQHSVCASGTPTGLTVSTYNDWNSGGTSVCGALTLSGSYCKRPVKGNSRCWQHSVCAWDTPTGSTISTYNDWNSGGTSVCGAPTRNGSYCKRAVKGGGTCWQH